MGKILGSWSGMRKYLEQEMLAECLHGRVRYNCTTYVGIEEYWDDFWPLMDAVPMQSRTEYTDDEFCEALERYWNQGIQDSVNYVCIQLTDNNTNVT